jgi:hypothetical protein
MTAIVRIVFAFLAIPVWIIGTTSGAHADSDCQATGPAPTAGSGPGAFSVGGSAAVEACTEVDYISGASGGHLELSQDPVCGLHGEAICYENQQCQGTGLLFRQPGFRSRDSPHPGQLNALVVTRRRRRLPR